MVRRRRFPPPPAYLVAGHRVTRVVTVATLALLAAAAPLAAQQLEDFDYENLSFRGIGLEIGQIWPSRVVNTEAAAVRVDLGYLGPGVRILPGVSYWSSRLKSSETRRLADRFESAIVRQIPDSVLDQIGPLSVNLGTVKWSDIALMLDAQVVWAAPFGLLTYAGVGASAHVLNGRGEFINGTFVEDLLDAVQAGVNVHGGAEYPLGSRYRLYSTGRFVALEDLHYLTASLGLQVMFGPAAPGELRRAAR
ncbi:MAG: hypothetical protein HY701_12555 [Gemmatimonadetes bacterium]|nr:hypothetical protein [Gemmatimonadota bacterium]